MTYFFHAILPISPTSNLTYRIGQGKFYTAPIAKRFIQQCQLAISKAEVDMRVVEMLRSQKKYKPNKRSMVEVHMRWYLKSIYTSDVDGRIKITQDAIFDYYGLNDVIVKVIVAEKLVDKQNPRCEVTISLL